MRNRGVIGNIKGAGFGTYMLAFICMFLLCVAFLAASDALPERLPNVYEDVPALFGDEPVAEEEIQNPENPIRVVAKSVGLDVTVSNPESTSVAALDAALLKGAIRYPTSAQLGINGTVVLFGHSSGLPVVHNRNFKAFNGIQNLKDGNIISVYSAGMEYRYAVTGVRLANSQEDVVELQSNGKFLTLVTCNNSFATKTSRYVVTAEFVEAYQHAN